MPSDDKAEDLTSRAPVVTIMGHVDHGKTSLLDAIRKANVVSGEAGGITQHIGAYQVEMNGQKITFLDTPGHEAFTAMRARGAQATDIAVLVVAADDGVMPQTIESIKHAKAAGVPIIVAINKMDKPSANPTARPHRAAAARSVRRIDGRRRARRRSFGASPRPASTSCSKPSCCRPKCSNCRCRATAAPKASSSKPSSIAAAVRWRRCWCSAARSRVGDIVVAGTEFARVRALIDDKGEQVKEAGPSTPVEVLGFTGVPSAGDRFSVVETEARAREVTDYRQRQMREKIGGRRRHQPRADDESAQGRRHRQVPADHQGRRAGLGRGDQRLAQQAVDR